MIKKTIIFWNKGQSKRKKKIHIKNLPRIKNNKAWLIFLKLIKLIETYILFIYFSAEKILNLTK